jgi:predicted N-acetyltransferase YhbS
VKPGGRVRPETAADLDAVRAVHVAAFPSSLEARLVDALRTAGKALALRATGLAGARGVLEGADQDVPSRLYHPIH